MKNIIRRTWLYLFVGHCIGITFGTILSGNENIFVDGFLLYHSIFFVIYTFGSILGYIIVHKREKRENGKDKPWNYRVYNEKSKFKKE